VFAYDHAQPVVNGDGCATGSSSITGVAFYEGGLYPDSYDGALFFADYARRCIWVLPPGADGNPDPNARAAFVPGAAGPVDLTIGPAGDLFYVDIWGSKIHRIQYTEGNRAPVAAVKAAPAAGKAPLAVRFNASTSADPDGDTDLHYTWDLDGDGAFDDASGVEVTWAFATAGDHLVQMRVTQANGRQAVAFATVPVAQRPAAPAGDQPGAPAGDQPPAPGPTGPAVPGTPVLPPPAPKRPVAMRPFPIVRIAGVVLPDGALIRILSVRAPRGSTVRLRCRGKGCPAAAIARTSATRLVRFRRFERRLRAGVRLELFVRKAGRIGKYTRFTIRRGKPPARLDRCLMPGQRRPVRCR
jgi:hypothetical protein